MKIEHLDFENPDMQNVAILLYDKEPDVIRAILEPYHPNNFHKDTSPHSLSRLAEVFLSPIFNVEKNAGISINADHFSYFMKEMHLGSKNLIGRLLVEREAITSRQPNLLLWSFPDIHSASPDDIELLSKNAHNEEVNILDEKILIADFLAYQFSNPDDISIHW